MPIFSFQKKIAWCTTHDQNDRPAGIKAQRLQEFFAVKRQSERGVNGNSRKQNPVRRNSPRNKLPFGFAARDTENVNLGENPRWFCLKIRLHARRRRKVSFALGQGSDFRGSDFRHHHQVRGKEFQPLEDGCAAPPEEPLGAVERCRLLWRCSNRRRHNPGDSEASTSSSEHTLPRTMDAPGLA